MESLLNSLAKRYARKLLTYLERDGVLTPDMRKVVLDAINDLVRDIHANLNRER